VCLRLYSLLRRPAALRKGGAKKLSTFVLILTNCPAGSAAGAPGDVLRPQPEVSARMAGTSGLARRYDILRAVIGVVDLDLEKCSTECITTS